MRQHHLSVSIFFWTLPRDAWPGCQATHTRTTTSFDVVEAGWRRGARTSTLKAFLTVNDLCSQHGHSLTDIIRYTQLRGLFTSIYMKCITNWYLGFTANHYTKYSEVELWGFQHRRDPKNGYIHSGLTTGNGMVWYHNIGMAIPKYGNHNSGLTTYYCMVW